MVTFTEILIAIVIGWALGMASTWLILARTLPWLDVKMLPRPAVRPAPKPDPIGLDPMLNGNSLPATQHVTA